MATFFKKDFVVNRSCDDFLSELSATTIAYHGKRTYSETGEFYGKVWQNGFKIALNTSSLNTPYWNSFASWAVGYVAPIGKNKCMVHISIGPKTLPLIFMIYWNLCLLFALIITAISLFSNSASQGLSIMLIFVPFIAVDIFFLRFALCSSYKRIKAKMFTILV